MKIAHLITCLSTAGAQMMLYKLLTGLQGAGVQVEVCSLADIGGMRERIRDIGVPVHTLGMRSGLNVTAFGALVGWLRRSRPDVLQTWMYHADLLGGLAARVASAVPVAWNIRHGSFSGEEKASTRVVVTACARLSRRLPRVIVCCSEAARRAHVGLGYPDEKLVVIPNGFDLEVFRPDAEARVAVRRELGVGEGTVLIGLVARHHPQKDHRTFIEAAALLGRRVPDVEFVLCGKGTGRDNRELAECLDAHGILGRFHLLDERADMPQLNAAFDIATVSATHGEGFPNVIGEAMACAVPCVVTDVGDAARIVGDTGRVVATGQPEALAKGLLDLVEAGAEGRRRLGRAGRERVGRLYGLAGVVSRYLAVYETMTGGAVQRTA